MKKLLFGLGALLLIAVIYYFTMGSAQITEEIKTQVNTQLTALKKQGFSIEDRKIEDKKEHFVISFDDTKKISTFLYQKGIQITADDALLLKGLKIGVDAYYLPDTYSSVSFDIYPVALPEILSSTTNKDEKKMLDQKTILAHIDINKLGDGFKGHMKDINTTIKSDFDISILLKNLHFKGDIKDNSIYSLKQDLEKFSISASDEMKITLSNVKSDYKVTGKTLYDYANHYKVANMLLVIDGIDITIKEINALSTSTVTNDTASGTIKTTFKQMHIADETEPYSLENFNFEMKASNVDVTAMDTMQKADLSDEKVMNDILKQLFSKGVHFEISDLSLESIESNEAKIDGFVLTADAKLDKNFDILSLETDPMSLIGAVDANLKFVFSPELYELIVKQPQVMMALMMFPPKDKNGKKVYTLKLKDGEAKVNGNRI
jgi:hypothetical protein